MSTSNQVLENLCIDLGVQLKLVKEEIGDLKAAIAGMKGIAALQTSADSINKQHGAVLSALSAFGMRLDSMEKSQAMMSSSQRTLGTAWETNAAGLGGQIDQATALLQAIQSRLAKPVPIDMQPFESTIIKRMTEEIRVGAERSAAAISSAMTQALMEQNIQNMEKLQAALRPSAMQRAVPYMVGLILAGLVTGAILIFKAANSAVTPMFDVRLPDGYTLSNKQLPGGTTPTMPTLPAASMRSLPGATYGIRTAA